MNSVGVNLHSYYITNLQIYTIKNELMWVIFRQNYVNFTYFSIMHWLVWVL